MSFITSPGVPGITSQLVTAAPNNLQNVVGLAVTVGTADGDLALLPKGSGALIADIPDNSTPGGAKRGVLATDWQRERSLAAAVASGSYSTIGGGRNNTASGFESVVSGGNGNQATGANATVGGGTGSQAQSITGTVGGGSSNIVDATSTAATIGGGSSNTTTAAPYATVGGGQNNQVSANFGCIPGGYGAFTRGTIGRFAYSSHGVAGQGKHQHSVTITKQTTTDATVTNSTVDAAAATTANTVVMADSSANAFDIFVTARQSATGDTKMWRIQGAAKRGVGAASAALVGAPTVTVLGNDAGAAAWTCAAVADTTLGAVVVTVTGEAAKTIIWNARIELVEQAA